MDTPTTPSRLPRAGVVLCLVVGGALLILSALAYPHMAAELVTRPAGERHGESSPSREFTAVALPLALVLIGSLVALAPRVTPRLLERFPAGAVTNTANSIKVLGGALALIAIIVSVLHVGLLAMYMGTDFPLEAVMGTVIGVVLIALGSLLPWTRPEGHFHNATLERFRAGSSRAYRPASYLLMTAGAATMVLAWVSQTLTMVVGVGAVALAFGFIAWRGLRAV